MSFNLNKLTVKAQEVVQNAVEIAQDYNNQVVEPEHLLPQCCRRVVVLPSRWCKNGSKCCADES